MIDPSLPGYYRKTNPVWISCCLLGENAADKEAILRGG
jgi:hypothetical protein